MSPRPGNSPAGAIAALRRVLTGRRLAVLLCCLIGGIHFFKVRKLVPVFDDGVRPVTESRHLVTVAAVLRGEAIQAETGRRRGYDPFIAAGVPMGFNVEDRLLSVVRATLPDGWPLGATQRGVLFALLFMGPILAYVAARAFGIEPGAALLAFAIATAGFGYFDPFGTELIRGGHANFFFACYLSVFVVAALYRFLRSPTPVRWVVLIVAVAAQGLASAHTLWLLLAPVVALTASIRPPLRVGALAAAALVAGVLPHVGGWVEAAAFLPFSTPRPWVSEGTADLIGLFLPVGAPAAVYGEAFLRGGLFIAALGGVLMLSLERRSVAAAWSAGLASAGVLAFAGGALPVIKQGGPDRFAFAAGAFAIIPASVLLHRYLFAPGSVRRFYALWALWFLMTWQLAHPRRLEALSSRFPGERMELSATVRRLPSTGPVLIENVFGPGSGAAIAHASGRAVIGLPSRAGDSVFETATAFTPQRRGEPAYLFGRNLALYSESSLRDALSRYGVEWIIAFSRVARDFFDGFPDAVSPVSIPSVLSQAPVGGPGAAVSADDPYRLYRVNGTTALAAAAVPLPGRLRVATASQDQVVLRYHWIPGLRASGAAVVSSTSPAGGAPVIALRALTAQTDITFQP